MELYLRKATQLDKKLIFDWANEAKTRNNSFHSEPILWEEHEAWFEKVLEAKDTFLFVCMDFMVPVGQIRVQLTSDRKGMISYSVEESHRGRGYGRTMLALLEKELIKNKLIGYTLIGETRPENEASGRAFLSQGYLRTEASKEKNCYCKEITAQHKETAEKNDTALQKREAKFEILRVLAMMMIIVLHYLSKGELLGNITDGMNRANCWFWFLEAACLVSVNVYVLISGYFLVNSRFSLGKLVNLWCRILFYSIGVSVVLVITGVVDYRSILNFYDLQFFCLPTINGHYWFATSYVIFYLLAPFLGKAAKAMKKKELKLLIFLLLIPFCFIKSILPVALPVDDLGNSFVWFICLFFIAAYIRLYGIAFFKTKWAGLAVYLMSVGGILLSILAAGSLVKQTGNYEYALTIPSNYNFFFVLTGSVGLFCAFLKMQFKNNILTGYLVRIAPYTFGVYLLHEHLLLRYEWPGWLWVSNIYGGYRVLHILFCTIFVLVIGILVDWIRSLIFTAIQKLIIFSLKIYYAKQEVWDYLIFGALATVVNWVVYIAFAYCFLAPFWQYHDTIREMTANVIAWIVAVLFAYWTNRTFVFHSSAKGTKAMLKEFSSFISARIFSFLVELGMFYIFVDWLEINDLISKLIISVVVIILNYIFSKLWIFKKKEK